MSMSDRLRHAREAAGYETATAAIEHFNWPSSTYRAHENGQNNYTPAIAKLYAKAFGITAAWLLLGDDIDVKSIPVKAIAHKHDCLETIQAATLLLKSDPYNLELINVVESCAASLRLKATRSKLQKRMPSSV